MKLKTYKLSKKRLSDFISNCKFLSDKKHYKNNIWSLAAFDSWAATGQAGSCNVCRSGYYDASLENKRRPGNRAYSNGWKCNSIFKACNNCKYEIEKEIGFKFQSR